MNVDCNAPQNYLLVLIPIIIYMCGTGQAATWHAIQEPHRHVGFDEPTLMRRTSHKIDRVQPSWLKHSTTYLHAFRKHLKTLLLWCPYIHTSSTSSGLIRIISLIEMSIFYRNWKLKHKEFKLRV